MICVVLSFAVLATACGGTDGAAPPSPRPTLTPEPDPSATSPAVHESRDVILVAADDVLNVRSGPGVDNEIVGTLEHDATDVEPTGAEEQVGDDRWVEVRTAAATGWVNSRFLTASVDDATFENDDRITRLVDQLAAAFAGETDLAPLISSDGLYVAHFEAPRYFPPSEIPGLVGDATLYDWAGTGCSPEECPDQTFVDAVAQPFVGAWRDDDRQVVRNEILTGPNGMVPEAVVPAEFANLPFVAVHDPGDDPQYDGLDWSSWYVYVVYESSRPLVLGLSVDAWAP